MDFLDHIDMEAKQKHYSLAKCTLNQSMHTNKRLTCNHNLKEKLNACTKIGNNYGRIFKYKYL